MSRYVRLTTPETRQGRHLGRPCVRREDVNIVQDEAICIYDRHQGNDSLDSLLQKVGGRVKRQWSVDTAQPICKGSKRDGTATAEYPTPVLKYIPYYTIELQGSDSDDISDMESVAGQAGVIGHYTFPSKRVASYMHKLWKLNAGYARSPLFVQNAICGDNQAATTEGYEYPYHSPNNQAPTDYWFWWCNQYSPSAPVGANINNTSTGEKLSDIATGASIKVGVIDFEFMDTFETGYMPGSIIQGYDVHRNDAANDPGNPPSVFNEPNALMNGQWHGRQVASLIFAPNNDSAGTLGTAPGAVPYLYKGYGTDASWAWCYMQAITDGCQVVNMSIGDTSTKPTLDSAIQYGCSFNVNPKVIPVVSACNQGDQTDYPAAYNNVISVSATNYDGEKATFANSLNVDIWAPGEDIAVASAPNSSNAYAYYQFMTNSGTSFSAPIVAGVVACMLQKGYVTDSGNAASRLQTKGYYYSYFSPGICLNALGSVKP